MGRTPLLDEVDGTVVFALAVVEQLVEPGEELCRRAHVSGLVARERD